MPQISLTDKAANVFRESCADEGKDLKLSFLRVGAKPGGCSGWKYELEWNGPNEVDKNDLIINSKGISVLVNKDCLNDILGSIQIDFNDKNLVEQGFVFNQLSNGSQCGCGESFTPVKDLKR